MNKADNKEKTKTPFSENSSFQEKYTQQSQIIFLGNKKRKSQLSKVHQSSVKSNRKCKKIPV